MKFVVRKNERKNSIKENTVNMVVYFLIDCITLLDMYNVIEFVDSIFSARDWPVLPETIASMTSEKAVRVKFV